MLVKYCTRRTCVLERGLESCDVDQGLLAFGCSTMFVAFIYEIVGVQSRC